jgi:feruloyl esterase
MISTHQPDHRLARARATSMAIVGALWLLCWPSVSTAAVSNPRCGAHSVAVPADVRISGFAMVDRATAWQPAPNSEAVAISVPFCRIEGVIDREIGFELWLPEPAAWNGKFLGAGVGGDAGQFNYVDLPRGVNLGYASATTDTGHKITDSNWMLGDPQRLINFEFRANHRLAQIAQQMTRSYYRRAIRHAYFIGCSGGGRQGLKEAQRFPADYDGIIAGAAGPNTPEMTVRRMWEMLLRDQHPGLLSPADWKHVADAAVQSCDHLDGVVDGIINDPRRCHFDPAALACPTTGAAEHVPQCLSPDQLALVAKIYAPLHDEDGNVLDTGLLPGVLVDAGHSRLAPAIFGQAVRRQADWNGQGFTVGTGLESINRVLPELRADDPNLEPFTGRGGKLIMYEGWNDPAVAARMVIAYFEAVVKTLGTDKSMRFLRLFMAPGVEHCRAGPGPDRFGGAGAAAPIADAEHDLLAALDAWITHGRAPERVIASKLQDGHVVMTRPLCAYPAAAHYSGGDSNSGSSFVCDTDLGDKVEIEHSPSE